MLAVRASAYMLAGLLAFPVLSAATSSVSTSGKCLLQKTTKRSHHASLLQKSTWLKEALAEPLGLLQPADPKAGAQQGRLCSTSPVAWWYSKLFGGASADPCRASLDLVWLREADFVQQPTKAPSDRDLFFRPVSVTVYCVMFLTVQSILIHTGVAVAHSSDELSAVTESSFATQVLEMAGRSVPLVPLMSLLFLANRIYMLESTNGLGEVEMWVKVCMLAASAGMACQLLTVVTLAITTAKSTHRFCEIGGDARDAHPHVLRYPFRGPVTKMLNLVLQTMSLVLMYGGVAGVTLGMVFSGRGFDPESAAVWCTAVIVILYFATQITLWATNAGVLKGKMDKYASAVRQAAVRGDTVVQKAPMFAVLVLSTRLRQVQQGIQGGTPAPFLTACFCMVVISLYVEVALCPFTTGELDEEDEEAAKDLPLSTRVLNYAQGVVSMIGLVSGCIIASSVMKPWVKGDILPMSPTIHSVLVLCLVFFLVYLLITLYGLARGLLRLTSSRAQDALLAARNSVGFCPLLCTLFLGCRMRALQITGNKGMPQWWEQDFMYLCVSATIVEVVCCITAPAFYKEVTVDAEGNPTYAMQTVTGTYIVTIVRYVGLLGLHGGILGVCASVILMTPESATGVRPSTAEDLRSIARVMLWILVVLIVACVLSSAKVVGLIVKLAIESVDQLLLNADITVETAILSLWRGRIIIKGLVVNNPLGSSYQSMFLFKVSIAAVKIDLWKVLRSLGRHIEISEVVLNGVELNYELGANGKPSNVGALLEFLEGEPEQPKQPPPPVKKLEPRPSFLESVKRSTSNVFAPRGAQPKPPPPPPPPPGPSTLIELHRILIKEVHARVLHPTMGPLVGVDLGKMDIEDFDKLSKGRRVGDIVVFVLKTVIRTAMTNADIVKHLLHQGTSHVISSVADRLKSCSSSCGAGVGKACLPAAASGGRPRPHPAPPQPP